MDALRHSRMLTSGCRPGRLLAVLPACIAPPNLTGVHRIGAGQVLPVPNPGPDPPGQRSGASRLDPQPVSAGWGCACTVNLQAEDARAGQAERCPARIGPRQAYGRGEVAMADDLTVLPQRQGLTRPIHQPVWRQSHPRPPVAVASAGHEAQLRPAQEGTELRRGRRRPAFPKQAQWQGEARRRLAAGHFGQHRASTVLPSAQQRHEPARDGLRPRRRHPAGGAPSRRSRRRATRPAPRRGRPRQPGPAGPRARPRSRR